MTKPVIPIEEFVSPNPAINLAAHDWYIATWRDLPQLERPPVGDFDMATMVKIITTYSAFNLNNLLKQPVNINMSQEEITFWVEFVKLYSEYEYRNHHLPMQPVVEILQERIATSDNSFDPMPVFRGAQGVPFTMPHVFVALWFALDIPKWVRSVGLANQPRFDNDFLRQYLVPYWSEDERQQIRDFIRDELRNSPYLLYDIYPIAALVGGMDDILLPHLKMMQRKYSGYLPHSIIYPAFGLDNPVYVSEWIKSINFTGRYPPEAIFRAWIAHHELNELEWLEENITGRAMTHGQQPLYEYDFFDSVEVIPNVIKQSEMNHKQSLARDWLTRHQPQATEVGVAIVLDDAMTDSELKDKAQRFLDATLHSKDEAYVKAVAATLSRADYDKLRTYLSDLHINTQQEIAGKPNWLAEVAAKYQDAIQNDWAWLDVAEVTRLYHGEYELTRDETLSILAAASANDKQVIALVRETIAPQNLVAFTLNLTRIWEETGNPHRTDTWKVLVRLCHEYLTPALTHFAKTLPQRGHARAAIAMLDALDEVGTVQTLSIISRTAWEVPFPKVHFHAIGIINRRALAEKLTREQYEDRFVPSDVMQIPAFILAPDAGISSAEAIDFILTSNSDVQVGQMPDDATLAKQAQRQQEILRADIELLTKVQAYRLQLAMRNKRRWTKGDLDTYYMQSSIMRHLMSRIVWASYTPDDNIRHTMHFVPDAKDRTADKWLTENGHVISMTPSVILGIATPDDLINTNTGDTWQRILGHLALLRQFTTS